MCKQLKIGVLGCANIAMRSLLPAIEQSDKFLVAGLASRSQQRASELAKLYGATPHGSYQSLIESDIDAIYIPLPNSLHYEWVKKSLNAGKHVLVEKSMTTNPVDCEELNNLAKEKKLALLENFQFRFHRQFEFIRSFISSQDFGELRLIRASFGFPPFSNSSDIRYNSELGGGSLLDAGAYPVKVSQQLLGMGLDLDAKFLYFDPGKRVDLWGSGTLVSRKEGVQSQISFGFHHCYQNTLELWGSKGHLLAKRIFTAGPQVAPTIQVSSSEGTKEISIPADNHFINMLDYFYDFCTNSTDFSSEYDANVDQARILGEFSGA